MTSRGRKGDFQDWAELRAHAIELFNGETPHPATEQQIIDAYEEHPQAVERELDAVAADLHAGAIRSGWAIYAKRAERILAPPANPTRPASQDREKAIARAEQWVRAAGIHIDRPDEILHELFGDGGQLRAYAQVDLESTTGNDGKPLWTQSEPKGDTALATRILDLWAEHRPTGMAIERDADARAEKWKQDQRRLAEMRADALAKLDDQQAHIKPLPEYDYTPEAELETVPPTDPEATLDDDIPF